MADCIPQAIQRYLMIATVFFKCLLVLGLNLHPFFVSMTEITHNNKEKTLELSVRIFTSDLEQILKSKTTQKVDLINGKNKQELDQLVYNYLSSHLQIELNNAPVRYQFIGYEIQSESVWSYLEISNVAAVKSIKVKNTLLYDFTKDQINMVHLKANGKEETRKLNYPDSQLDFKF